MRGELTKAHLIRREERRETMWYELVYDRMVQPIRQSNAEWRQANPFHLNARPWKRSGKSPELLLKGQALVEAEAWAAAHPAALSALHQEYLKASRVAYTTTGFERSVRAEMGVNLEETGWGVIFAADADPAIREALRELLDHRRAQATQLREDYYREFKGSDGYRAGETAQQFLARFGVGYGPATPEKAPYYLLIVADPATIPFEFQYDLDVQYAVGRIYFETMEEHASCARSVVLAESGSFYLPNRAAFFVPQHPDDRGTEITLTRLVRPLVEIFRRIQPNWFVAEYLAEAATKDRLGRLLGGPDTPALLFSVAHGMQFKEGAPQQVAHQGALLCQDWPGPLAWQQPIPEDFYFASDHLRSDANLLGLVAFLWGSYTAGTPRIDSCSRLRSRGGHERQHASRSFISALPQRMLGLPRGGALAVVGMVETAWSYAFQTEEGVSDPGTFTNTLDALMKGYTVGKGMESFNRRYAALTSLLGEELKQVMFYDKARNEYRLERMVAQTIDARSILLLGDPAVRLPVCFDQPYSAPDAGWVRPAIEAVGTTGKQAVQPTPPVVAAEPAGLLYFNGIDGDTGAYAAPPISALEFAVQIGRTDPTRFRERAAPENLPELRFLNRVYQGTSHGVRAGIDPRQLDEAGWGVIFPAKSDPAIQEALGELLALRRSQAGERFKIFAGADGYGPGETKTQFLARYGVGLGPADIVRMPYYLLLVADPATISYSFETQLDVQYAVGRIHFATPDEYAAYAAAVVRADTGQITRPRWRPRRRGAHWRRARFWPRCRGGGWGTRPAARWPSSATWTARGPIRSSGARPGRRRRRFARCSTCCCAAIRWGWQWTT